MVVSTTHYHFHFKQNLSKFHKLQKLNVDSPTWDLETYQKYLKETKKSNKEPIFNCMSWWYFKQIKKEKQIKSENRKFSKKLWDECNNMTKPGDYNGAMKCLYNKQHQEIFRSFIGLRKNGLCKS